jgi:hypothetical protein
MLLEGAVLAHEKAKTVKPGHQDEAFYGGKIATALYYAKNVLPGVDEKARILAEEDKSAIEISDAAFATV